MTRTKSKATLGTAFFALLLGTTMLSAPARAEWIDGDVHVDDNGDTLIWMYETDTQKWALWVTHPDNTNDIWEGDEDSNPNPEETSTGPGSHSDKPDVIGLIKSGKATYTVHLAPLDSAEFMSHIKGGDGLGPHYNPGDQDDGHGPGSAPVHSMTVKKTAAEIRSELAALNAMADALQIIETSMGSGDEDGSESANGPGKGNGKGGKVDDSGNYTEGQNKTVGKTEKDLLGAHPEVINPPHLNKVGKTGGAGSGKTTGLSVTGKGLLDGGASFNQNGPSAMGSPGAGGGGGSAVGGVGIRGR